MSHAEIIRFELEKNLAKCGDKLIPGEAMIAAYLESGVPETMAYNIVEETVNDRGYIDVERFQTAIDNRLQMLDALARLAKEKASNA